MRFVFIDDHRDHWPVSVPCDVLAVSCSGYYAWRNRGPSPTAQQRATLTEQIRQVHQASRATYGAPRVHAELVAKCMKQAGIQAKTVKKFRLSTKDSNHPHPVAANLVNRNFQPSQRNETWTADITDVATDEGWLYLAAIEDLFTREIVGWSMSDRIDSRLVADALEMAIARQCPGADLMAHSDRGVQSASEHYQRLLAKHGITCSMSRKGNCWEATKAAEPWRGSRPQGGSTPRPDGILLRHLEKRTCSP